MSAPPNALRTSIDRAIRDRRLAIIDELGELSILWLAIAPLWTRSAAETTGFPVSSVADFVRQAQSAGWCETRGALLGHGSAELRFWMPDEVRPEVIDAIRERIGNGQVREVTREAAAYVANLDPDLLVHFDELPGSKLPGALRAWAGLLTGADLNGVPALLVERVSHAIDARDLKLAQELVTAGEALAPVLAGTAEQALSRARRLLALGMRRRQDERALTWYLDRPELSDAVTRLLDPAAPQWALHLRGIGGVGKTMLIRYLASGRYAEDRGRVPVPMARIDFDHISPDYPVRRPVQLLLELADELALHTAVSERADRALRAFRDDAIRAHEAVSGLREAGGRPLENPEVRRAVDGFGTVINELGGALLILDTCEELAKADAGNPAAPAVRATLDILERLQSLAASVRVLLAGRRPLPARDYLKVMDVAGFTVEEARRYLAVSSGCALADDLAEAMIRQSPAIDDARRVSPFDLALYRSWADENPDLLVADVERGSDAYVEGRIIERLDNPLVTLALPLLAVGGQCRVETLAAVLECDAAALGQRLAEQEWITAAEDPPMHVTAQPALARRLRRYFSAHGRRGAFEAITRRFAEVLLSQLSDAPLTSINVDELLATSRLSTPSEAATLWDSIVAQAMQPPGRWGTILNMTRRILGEWDEEAWPTTQALRAPVLAAHIAGIRRDTPLLDVSGMWTQVLDSAEGILRTRAALGMLPAGPGDESLWAIIGEGRSSLVQHPVLGTAAIATMHRLLEAGHPDAAARLDDLLGQEQNLFATLGAGAGPRARAWAHVAVARLVADADQAAARRALEFAEADASRDGSLEQAWPDWIPPDDLLARVRIERGLIAPPDLSALDEWEAYATDHLDSIDGDRLASLSLRLRLRQGVVPASVAERWESADRYIPGRVATNSAHDLIPPLFVSVAEAWLSAGQPERALALLDRRRGEALATREDNATIRYADAETIRIARRLRMDDQRSLLNRLAADPAMEEPARLARAVIDQEGGGIADRLAQAAPELRSAEPYRDIGVALLRAAQDRKPFRPRPGVPHRLLADMAFEDAELLALQLPDVAERLFRAASDEYTASDDHIGRLLALASIGADVSTELDALRSQNPELVAKLTGPPEDAGPWRYWARVVHRLTGASDDAQVSPPDSPNRLTNTVPLAAQLLIRPLLRVAVLGLLGGFLLPAIAGVVVLLPSGRSFLGSIGVSPALNSKYALYSSAIGLFGLAAWVSRQIIESLRPMAGRGVGAARVEMLYFRAAIGEDPAASAGTIGLHVSLRPWRTVPVRAKLLGWATYLARWLFPSNPTLSGRGYQGSLQPGKPASHATPLHWTDPRPHAGRRWWRRGREPAMGVIGVPPDEQLRPWERMLAESLSEHAAGRIEWVRMLAGSRPSSKWGTRGTSLFAPRAWVDQLGGGYAYVTTAAGSMELVDPWFRHAIGRVVMTSAGPCMDISGSSAPSPDANTLLEVRDLARHQPFLVLLQAEPTGEDANVGVNDDLAEKVQLAMGLIDDGVQAVLLLPTLPAAVAAAVAVAARRHLIFREASADDVRIHVLRNVRTAIAPHVKPEVLDGIILFLNENELGDSWTTVPSANSGARSRSSSRKMLSIFN